MLRRWAAQSEYPLPEDFRGFASANMEQAVKIMAADPELVSILDGSASAGLKADVIDGVWPEVCSTPEQQAAEKQQQMGQELFDSKPFEKESFNLTRQMMMQAVAPEAAAEALAAATPDDSRPDLTEAQLRAAEAEETRVRQASVIRGMAMSKAQYERARIRRDG